MQVLLIAFTELHRAQYFYSSGERYATALKNHQVREHFQRKIQLPDNQYIVWRSAMPVMEIPPQNYPNASHGHLPN